MIEHTLLKPTATEKEVEQLCAEARKYGFSSVVVSQAYVPLARKLLAGSNVRIGTVVGFPHGSSSLEAKAFAAKTAVRQGASEVDMVLNVGALKSGDYALVKKDIRAVVKAVQRRGAIVKVILETSLLTDPEKETACRLALASGADFVKTSTGFGPGGATVADVALMRRVVGPGMRVKAAGGIRTLEQLIEMVAVGADRIGTSSGVSIMEALSKLA